MVPQSAASGVDFTGRSAHQGIIAVDANVRDARVDAPIGGRLAELPFTGDRVGLFRALPGRQPVFGWVHGCDRGEGDIITGSGGARPDEAAARRTYWVHAVLRCLL